MKKPAYSVAVVGATGIVGAEIVAALDERAFPVGALQPYASLRTAGDDIRCGQVTARVELLDSARFAHTDIVFLAAGEHVSAEWIPRATEGGAVVIDTSQLFAAEEDVPLIVPEVNAERVAGYVDRGILASPDPAAIALSVVLKPLHDAAPLARIVASTLESASGAGRAGIEELQQQTIDLMHGRSVEPQVFPRRLAFNVVPQMSAFLAGGAAHEEQQTTAALRRLLAVPDLGVSITRVRTPLFYGIGVSLNVQTARPLSAVQARDILRQAPGILLLDDGTAGEYPTPADAVGQDAVSVGRVRESDTGNVLDLWIAMDNVRKGAAVNAVQIAEILIRDYL